MQGQKHQIKVSYLARDYLCFSSEQGVAAQLCPDSNWYSYVPKVMEKDSEKQRGRGERGESQTNNKIRTKISLQVRMYYPYSVSRELRRKCIVLNHSLTVKSIFHRKPIGILYSLPTFNLCSILLYVLCLHWTYSKIHCVKLFLEVVIRTKLSCSVYLSRVNALQGNERGQE